ncbi:MAG: hypothetical protein IJ588_13720 [Prevotella sp.]|nr:hypothetical protein [Prevotella sp.]
MNIFKKIFCRKQQDNGFAALVNLHVLRADNYPCDKCTIEDKHCFKLHFADRTICVCPHEYVNSFRPKRTQGIRKPQSKV